MNFFKTIAKMIQASSLIELIIALLIAMIVFYMSMSILLKFNYNRLFRDEQIWLIEYNSGMLVNKNLPSAEDRIGESSLKLKISSVNCQGCYPLPFNELMILNEKGKIIFQISGIVKE